METRFGIYNLVICLHVSNIQTSSCLGITLWDYLIWIQTLYVWYFKKNMGQL